MRALLSYSKKHYDADTDTLVIPHGVAREAQIWYKVMSEMYDTTYIDSTDKSITSEKYDVLVSLPNNYAFLTQNNEFTKKVISMNLPEPTYLARTLSEEATRLGCRLTDCFRPSGLGGADKYVIMGGNFNRRKYIEAGYPEGNLVQIKYGADNIPFTYGRKNKRPIFLHVATTLGLRKGFWHVVNDFLTADINAELWCVGGVQNEKFWLDFATKSNEDKRIKILGWVDNTTDRYKWILSKADFVVFPSFGEGQPSSVMEAIAAGCIPMTSEESGVPFGFRYNRGDIGIWFKMFHYHKGKIFNSHQESIQNKLKREGYTYEEYENIVRKILESL